MDLLRNVDYRKGLFNTLKQNAKKYSFDGYVVEVWPQVKVDINYDALTNLIQYLGRYISILFRINVLQL